MPGIVCGSYGCRLPSASRISPTTIIKMTEPANRYVGTAKARPASLSPRRFPRHISRTTPTQISSLYGPIAGNADATAAVPAAIWTATVTT